jgi:hypothetical protein
MCGAVALSYCILHGASYQACGRFSTAKNFLRRGVPGFPWHRLEDCLVLFFYFSSGTERNARFNH